MIPPMERRVVGLLPMVLLMGIATGLGVWVALRWVGPQPRVVDASRVEGCLQAFIEFRRSGDENRLHSDLERLKVSRSEFERIIDRFIHYRISKSALDQARKLLEAFKGGYNIQPERVFEPARPATYSFQLDAEVLTVITERPELVSQAFGS